METVLFVLFQYLHENQSDDTNVQIANKMIKNIHQIKNMSLDEAAILCCCSESTLKRFCRYIGFDNWKILKKTLNSPALVFSPGNLSFETLLHNVNYNLIETYNYLTNDKCVEIVSRITQSNRIVIIGFPRHLPYIIDFQAKMMMDGMLVEVIPYSHFISKLETLDKKDFVFVISLQGNFFDKTLHRKKFEELSLKGVKTVLITQAKNAEFFKTPTFEIKCGDYGYFGEASYSLIYLFSRIEQTYKMVAAQEHNNLSL